MQAAAVRRNIMGHLRSGGWFFAAGLAAGVFNYLFQVLASRELSSADFAALNGWFANLAVFFFLGGILQYGSVFFPASKARLKIALLVMNVLSLAFVWWWFMQSQPLGLERAVMVLVVSAGYGWILGQLQSRLAFTLLAVASFLQAAMKIACAMAPWFAEHRLEAYAFSFLATLLPSQWIASIALLRADVPKAPERLLGWRAWIAPVLLSCAVAIMPQYDLVLMSHTQVASVFEEFARASLFYKGVYFVLFIVAQWLLPQQVQRTAEVRNFTFAVVFALAASIVITLVAPTVARLVLKWDHDPGSWLILGSCLHMSLLTLTFLGIQQACADGRVWVAAVTIALILVKGALQFAIGLEAATYLVCAIVLQLPIMWLLFGRKTNDQSQLIT